MSEEENQIEIPYSFIALFLRPGRTTPTQPHAVILARYDRCEDLAQAISQKARETGLVSGVGEGGDGPPALEELRQGLGKLDVGINEAEQRWVLCRIAELLGIALPGSGIPEIDGPDGVY